MKHLTRCCYLLFFVVSSSFSLHAQWQYLGSPETGWVRDLSIDDDKIIIRTAAGIFLSEDAAESWVSIPVPDSLLDIYNIELENSSIYITVYKAFEASFQDEFVYRTDDFGQHWQLISSSIQTPAFNLEVFVHEDTVLIFTYTETHVSFDKGNSFTAEYPPIKSLVQFNCFKHNGDIYYFTGAWLIRSENHGASWDTVYNDNSLITGVTSIGDNLWKVEYHGGSTGVIVSSSDDDGQNWHPVDSLMTPFLESGKIIGDDIHLFLVDDDQADNRFLYSEDGGNSWTTDSIFANSLTPRYEFSEYVNGALIMTNFEGLFTIMDNGASFQKSTTGLKAASVESITHAGSALWVNANDASFRKNANQSEWTEQAGVKNVSSTPGGYLVGVIDRHPYRSVDEGNTWVPIPSETFENGNFPEGIRFIAAGNMLYLFGYPLCYYSVDDGFSWIKVEVPNIFSNNISVVAYNGNYVASSVYGDLFESGDGIHWDYYHEPDAGFNIDDIAILHPYLFFSAGEYIARIHPDSGNLVQIQDPFPIPISYHGLSKHVSLVSYGNMLIAAYSGYGIFGSVDYGATWFSLNHGLSDFQSVSLSIVNTDLMLGVEGGVWSRPLSELGFPFQYQGTVFNDTNANGIHDDNEEGLAGIKVLKENQVYYALSGYDGQFAMLSDNNEPDTLTAIAPLYAIVTTPRLPITSSASDMTFGIHYLPGIFDVSVSLTNLTPLRPGFISDFYLTYRNEGNEATDVILKFHPDEQLEFVTSTIPPTVTADTLEWHFVNVPPRTSGNMILTMYTPASVPIGAVLNFSTWVDVTEQGEITLANNRVDVPITVVGAIDPNDKAVFPEGIITPVMIADTQKLEYTIRFQNTGNYPASFVRIQDTLSENVDISSLKILAASHDFIWELLPNRVLDVYFPNINLPDSISDERASHGFVKFSVNAKPTLQLADRIENKAYIYFDYNLPVITNTVGSTVSLGTGINTIPEKLFISVSPVPAKDFLHVQLHDHDHDGDVQLSLFDVKGILMKSISISISDPVLRMDLRDIPSGYYILQVTSAGKTGTSSVVKQ